MHPRNIYNNPPDFKQLAIDYPSFRKYTSVDLSGKVQFSFKNPEAVSELSKTLLLKDFNIKLELPPGKLIPTIPLRLNYILWIEDLLAGIQNINLPIIGVDIGTGASCIYPLLGAKKGWHFLATELNDSSINAAQKNVDTNNFTEVINLKHVINSNLILKDVIDPDKQYHFSMCNPPFFRISETAQQRTNHRQAPSNGASGEHEELSTDGGEVKFVQRIIEDSEQLKNNILIYTTMVGKRSSLKILKEKLQTLKVKSLSTTSFEQGKTTRWGLAWSFAVDLPSQGSSPKKKKKDKQFVPFVFELPEGTKLEDATTRLKDLFIKLEMDVKTISESPFKCDVTARTISWRNQRRKRREQQRQDGPPEKRQKLEQPEVSGPPVLQFEILVTINNEVVSIEIHYTAGECGKNGVYEVIQYLKNNWVKP